MELIEVINSSLIIFFGFVSVTAVSAYVTYKVKDKARIRSVKPGDLQVERTSVYGIYPKMFSVNSNYTLPAQENHPVKTETFNIFKLYSFNLSEKMNKLRFSAK
jgi:hypothetical protein